MLSSKCKCKERGYSFSSSKTGHQVTVIGETPAAMLK
jgi:hypothetical protein